MSQKFTCTLRWTVTTVDKQHFYEQQTIKNEENVNFDQFHIQNCKHT